ncbi:MAG: flavoprotein [Treponema sp.]|nr:flavoprotein [Treponema sp.]
MGKKILLNVTGSISCYKACALISLLTKKDYEVRVIATEDALKFVGEASFEGLSHNKLETSMFGNDDPIPHIHLAQNWADLIISYPASANTINRLACGLADDLFGAVCLANNFEKPLLIAPAMNTNMFQHPAVQESLEKLKKWGATILPCGDGNLACGTKGIGRLLEPAEAVEFIEKALTGENA